MSQNFWAWFYIHFRYIWQLVKLQDKLSYSVESVKLVQNTFEVVKISFSVIFCVSNFLSTNYFGISFGSGEGKIAENCLRGGAELQIFRRLAMVWEDFFKTDNSIQHVPEEFFEGLIYSEKSCCSVGRRPTRIHDFQKKNLQTIFQVFMVIFRSFEAKQ